jgi:hypothetical protein
MIVKDLWQHVLDIGYITRKTGCDGLQMWQPLKNFYSKYEIKSNNSENEVPVNDTIKKLSEQVKYTAHDQNHDNVDVKINDTQLKNSKETDHFIIQHIRIPMTTSFKLPLVKLLQIAYNVGQAKAEFEKNTYNEGIKYFYKEHKLSDITTFVSEEVANSQIAAKNTQYGGESANDQYSSRSNDNTSYYEYKYNKYKSKYHELKYNSK